MEFGEKLGLLLKERKLSQTKFGKEIGVNNVSVNQYISGSRVPPTEVIQKVIEYFTDVDLNWLLRKEATVYQVNEQNPDYKIPDSPAVLIENIERNLKELKAKMSQK